MNKPSTNHNHKYLVTAYIGAEKEQKTVSSFDFALAHSKEWYELYNAEYVEIKKVNKNKWRT